MVTNRNRRPHVRISPETVRMWLPVVFGAILLFAFRCTQWELRISERFYSYSTGTWPARDTLPWSL
ncbi:MAG: hypothetical protein D6741_14835, partial [Planctomycetota bacterium]